jgi:hypothetical protein
VPLMTQRVLLLPLIGDENSATGCLRHRTFFVAIRKVRERERD